MGEDLYGMRESGLEHHLENKFYVQDLGRQYPEILSQIMAGRNLPSRNGPVYEIDNASLVLTVPERCVVSRDHFSLDFMQTEIMLLLAGRHEDKILRDVTPAAADMITPLTAYGPRTWEQLLAVEQELATDRLSRRAVVYVGRADDLSQANDPLRAGEMPCTCLWQFMVRPIYRGDLVVEDSLFMTVYMRSWDAVWGLSYDVPCFVAVQMALAKSLNIPLGHYRHHAGSLHVYQKHFPLAISAQENYQSVLSLPYLKSSMRATQAAANELVNEKLSDA